MALSCQNGFVCQMLSDNHLVHQSRQLQSVWRDGGLLFCTESKIRKEIFLRAANSRVWENFVLPLYIKLSKLFIRFSVSLKFKSSKSCKFQKGLDEFAKFRFSVPFPPVQSILDNFLVLGGENTEFFYSRAYSYVTFLVNTVCRNTSAFLYISQQQLRNALQTGYLPNNLENNTIFS